MKKLNGLERATFLAMRGSFAENELYCSKEGILVHFGVPFVGKGGRTDRNEVFAMLQEGKTDYQIMELDFSGYARFRNSIADYRQHIVPKRTHQLEVYLFYGPPGTGKTKFAYSQLGPDMYRVPVADQFWLTQTATGKKMILVDEFRANLKLYHLLQLLDENPVEIQKKGGFVWWCPDVIVITTNKSIHDWYSYQNRDMEKEALFRRFDNGGVFRFEKNPEGIPSPFRIDINNPVDFEYPWVAPEDRILDKDQPRSAQSHRELEVGMLSK